MANRVVHFEIPADDPARAKKFYEDVFGWEIKKWEGGNDDYWLVMTGPKEEPGIDGGLMRRETGSGTGQGAFVCTVAVDSVDEMIVRVKQAGGKILTDKMEIPTVGWMYYLSDSEGNQFGIIQMLPGAMTD